MKPTRYVFSLVAVLFASTALHSSAAILSVQSKVLEVWVRDWGMHVVLASRGQVFYYYI